MITFYTGTGGADTFEEAIENNVGLSRVYGGRKIPRILRKKYHWRKSHSGKWFRTIGFKPLLLDDLVLGVTSRQEYSELTLEKIEQAIGELFNKPSNYGQKIIH